MGSWSKWDGKSAISDSRNPDLPLLIAKLNGLPLALAQAGSFIGRTAVDVPTYIKFFDQTWSDLMEKQDQFPLQEYGERSMLTTWKLSYDQVLRQSETAAWLLKLWAFLYPDDLWFGLLAPTSELAKYDKKFGVLDPLELPPWLDELAGSELEFSSAMGLLKAYSLADSQGAGSYTMHSVLHQWSRSLSQGADAVSLLSVTVCLLGTAVPMESDRDYWKLDRRLLQRMLHVSHELPVLQRLEQQDLLTTAIQSLADHLGRHRKPAEAERAYLQALAAREAAFGPDHDWTLRIVNNLGLVYCNQGRLDQAQQMYERALAGKEKSRKPDDTSTLNTVHNLAVVFRMQGKFYLAEQMSQRALRGREKELGPYHETTLITINGLGMIYREQGRPDEAQQMYQRVLDSHERVDGPGAVTTPLVLTVHNLGELYYDQGRLDEAEQMYARALAGYQEMYGHVHDEVTEMARWLEQLRSKIGGFSILSAYFLRSRLTYLFQSRSGRRGAIQEASALTRRNRTQEDPS